MSCAYVHESSFPVECQMKAVTKITAGSEKIRPQGNGIPNVLAERYVTFKIL